MFIALTLLSVAILFLMTFESLMNFANINDSTWLFGLADGQAESGSKSVNRTGTFAEMYDWIHVALNHFMDMDELYDLQPVCNSSTEFLRAHRFGIPRNDTGPCGRHYTYISSEACDIASRYNQILLFGESLCRHVAMALLSILRGNLNTGATKEWELPPTLNCSGEMQYTEYECRRYCMVNSFWIAGSENESHAFCPGRRVYTHFLEWWRIQDVKTFFGSASKYEYLGLDRIEPYSAILIYPPGLHADMRNPRHMLSHYVQPIVDAALRLPGTMVVIIGIHSMGSNMPSAYAAKQNEEVIVPFNRALQEYAEAHGLGYLDTFNLTKGHYTSDGVHYGMEANLLKAQLLLNYLDLFRSENPANTSRR